MDSRFFQNRACAYFPCHKGIEEADFNCLFCYCPLYALGRACGGHFYYNEAGYKLCETCTFPHHKSHYECILARYEDIMAVVRRMDQEHL